MKNFIKGKLFKILNVTKCRYIFKFSDQTYCQICNLKKIFCTKLVTKGDWITILMLPFSWKMKNLMFSFILVSNYPTLYISKILCAKLKSLVCLAFFLGSF